MRLGTIWLKQALPAIGDAAVDNFFGRVTVQSAAVQQVDSLGDRLLRLDRLFSGRDDMPPMTTRFLQKASQATEQLTHRTKTARGDLGGLLILSLLSFVCLSFVFT
ncbi:hypothetical protein LNP05_09555 [Klebsiella pneumoniae subsp. pneumoniae]|nr:hypothetical protein [Klebsiella pneumoniae subsp. pneumoniae]